MSINPLVVTENKGVKLMWDMTVYTDKKLKHNKPDITLLLKEEKNGSL